MIVRDGDVFDVAFHVGSSANPPAPAVHVGFRAFDPAHVRAVAELPERDGVSVVERCEDDLVSCKCLDPDGYVVATYWAP